MNKNDKPYAVVAIKDEAGFASTAIEVIGQHGLHMEAVRALNDLEKKLNVRKRQGRDIAGTRQIGLIGPVGLFHLRPIAT